MGYVAAAGVVAQLSIQAIEDPNTPVEIYTQTQTQHTKKHLQTPGLIKVLELKNDVPSRARAL